MEGSLGCLTLMRNWVISFPHLKQSRGSVICLFDVDISLASSNLGGYDHIEILCQDFCPYLLRLLCIRSHYLSLNGAV